MRERVWIRALGKLSQNRWRNIAYWMAWTAPKKCGRAQDGKATRATQTTPLVVMFGSVTSMPISEFCFAFVLPRKSKECPLCPLRSTKGASVSCARADGHGHEQATGNNGHHGPSGYLKHVSLAHCARILADQSKPPMPARLPDGERGAMPAFCSSIP
jgi:hypothetical protein